MAATTAAKNIVKGILSISMDQWPEEFWSVVDTYRGELVNQALAVLGNLEDAEDCAQETFCEAFRDPQRLGKVESLGAFLRSINKANALDRLRFRHRDTRKKQDSRRLKQPRSMTTGGFSLLELREALAQAIEVLPEQQRAVVVLRFWEHLSYDEIGQRLNLPTTSVWRLFYEASAFLHSKLEPSLGAPAPGQEDKR